MKAYFELNRQIFYWLFVAPALGRMFSVGECFRQAVRIGIQALPMAALTAFSVGFTLAMQGAEQLGRMGADDYVPDLVALTLLRELGPLLIATIVIGRSGSAVTAELGTMKVSEEIEALETMAIDPVRFLVIPRVLALMILLPFITVFGNYIGMFGGWTIAFFSLEMNTSQYIMRCLERCEPWDLYSGLVKSVVFAWLIATISCHKGLTVNGGAEGVGLSTTSSVVTCMLSVLVANALLTALFFFA